MGSNAWALESECRESDTINNSSTSYIKLDKVFCLSKPRFPHLYKVKESESEVAQSCLTLCDPVVCSPPGSSIHGILQARILEWVAISFSRGSSRPRDPGIKPRSPALQADALTSEPPGKLVIQHLNFLNTVYFFYYGKHYII